MLFNSVVGPTSTTKISFYLLSICLDEILSLPKITYLWHSPFDKEKIEYVSNPIP